MSVISLLSTCFSYTVYQIFFIEEVAVEKILCMEKVDKSKLLCFNKLMQDTE